MTAAVARAPKKKTAAQLDREIAEHLTKQRAPSTLAKIYHAALKKLPVPLPFERKPQIPSRWHDRYTREVVPIDRMIATQTNVTERGVRQYKAAKSLHDIDLPVVYRTDDGRLYIADGHHRIVAAMRRGDRTLKARVINIGDPDHPREPI